MGIARFYKIRKYLHGNVLDKHFEVVSCSDIAEYMRKNYNAVILCGSTLKWGGEFLVFQAEDLTTHYKVYYTLPNELQVYNFVPDSWFQHKDIVNS